MSDSVNPIPPQLRGRHPDPTGTPDFVWLALTDQQTDGLACVICDRDFLTAPSASVPVGYAHVTGTQVFACADRCAEQATEPISDDEAGDAS